MVPEAREASRKDSEEHSTKGRQGKSEKGREKRRVGKGKCERRQKSFGGGGLENLGERQTSKMGPEFTEKRESLGEKLKKTA